MNSFISAVVILLILQSAAFGQGRGGGQRPAEAQVPDVDGESLILQIPDKWYPYSKETEVKVDTFVFPTGQKPEKWKESLRYERFLTTVGATEARQVYDLKIESNATKCVDYEAAVIKDEPENGYSMIEWSEHCLSKDNKPFVMLNKAILGFEQLYVVSKIWKYEPKENDMNEWLAYMEQVYVCDPTIDADSCRPPHPPQGGRRPGGR